MCDTSDITRIDEQILVVISRPHHLRADVEICVVYYGGITEKVKKWNLCKFSCQCGGGNNYFVVSQITSFYVLLVQWLNDEYQSFAS